MRAMRGFCARTAVSSSGVRAKTSGTPASRAVSLIRATKKRSLTIATTWGAMSGPPMSSIILLTDAERVALPLGDEGQAREVAHPVRVDDALQVVGLVLDHPREELLRHEIDPLAGTVEALEPHLGEARHAPAHVGDGQAALPAL